VLDFNIIASKKRLCHATLSTDEVFRADEAVVIISAEIQS
jgi:hypothetical protein